MEFSRPRPSILSLFDPLSLTPELDRTTSSDSDKENDPVDTSDFYLSGTQKHIHPPPRTLKRRLVDIGDTTVDIHDLLSDELEQELSYIVNDDDDENETLTFRDMAKAASPKWSSRSTTAFETPKASLPRTPLAEISLKDESTPLARKKLYKRQPVSIAPKDSQSISPVFPPFISSGSSSGYPPHAEVPEVRVNDEPVPQNPSIPANSLGDPSSCTSNRSTSTEALVGVPSIPVDVLPSSLVVPEPSRAQARARNLSPASPTDNANRYSVDLQTSFQIHFPSHDTTFDLLKDKISFLDSKNEFDSFFNNLEEDSSLDDDISIPGPGFKIESESGVSSMIILNQVQRLIDHPDPVSKDAGFTESSKASPTNIDASTPVQPPISNQTDTTPPLVADTKVTLVQPDAFQTTTSTSLPPPLMANSSRPPSSSGGDPRHPPPQIPALRIVKRSKTIIQQKPSTAGKDSSPQDALISVGPVTEAPGSSSLVTITKKGHPSQVSQVQRTDKTHLPPSLVSNGPRRVLISEGPKLKKVSNARASASLEQVKHSSYSGPRRVAMAVPPTVIERASSSTRPPALPSSGLGPPVKYGASVVKPVQRMAGSRLPAITKRIGSGT